MLIAYSDHHFFHGWPEFNEIESNGFPRWLNLQRQCWSEINTHAELIGATKLFTGDLYHKRSFTHSQTHDIVMGLYKNSQAKEIMIPGNHDRFNQEVNLVKPLDGIGQTVVLQDSHRGITYSIDGRTFKVVYYGISAGAPVPEITDGYGDQVIRILLCHGVVQGASSPSGFEFTSGYGLKELEAFDLVIMGDIHKRQVIGNVLIPGATMQHSWGDSGCTNGYWMISLIEQSETGWQQIGSRIWLKFIPLDSYPRFIHVTAENFEEIIKANRSQDYYDFRTVKAFSESEIKELKVLFPYSYFTLISEEAKDTSLSKSLGLSARKHGPDEILSTYYKGKQLGEHLEKFVELGLAYLHKSGLQGNRGQRNLEFQWMKAKNFMAYESVEVNFEDLENGLYLVTGSSDEETSSTNGVAKSTLAVEIISYTLFDSLTRSKVRSKDRLIHNPEHLRKVEGLLTEVGLKINGTPYVIQRYRKHPELGTGSRVFVLEKQ